MVAPFSYAYGPNQVRKTTRNFRCRISDCEILQLNPKSRYTVDYDLGQEIEPRFYAKTLSMLFIQILNKLLF